MPAADFSSFNSLSDLRSTPIDPNWIVDGAPAARSRKVAGSSDHSAWTMLWDCTAGRFNWRYKVDETVHILEGSATVTVAGQMRTLRAGDIAFFPAGAVAHWRIENYVRKLAFCQRPVPKLLGLPLYLTRRALAQVSNGVALVKGSLVDPLPQNDAQQSDPLAMQAE